ncbi:DUF2190 family protein [Azospirillum brasilense]|uniref:DUF2190 family protein n=1 Tax=Azospirillum brasilense TaxID=192 RepID=A0A235H4I6_AZOBR|nr:DUF2190 family protein [Azospirillum brasilense]OYD80115.1 hypothetical protein CHT98_32905 [Azospirillum brasilense]
MKNYIQAGHSLPVPAPYVVASGAGVLVGSLFGIAAAPAEAGETVQLATVGVFEIAKVSSEAWSLGDLVYWDDAAKAATKTAAGNKCIGVVVASAGGSSATGRVRLNGAFTA